MCFFSDALLEARGTTEAVLASEPIAQRPLSTPDMDAHEAEEMANSMLRNSPLPDAERSDEKLPDDGGGEKLPEEEGGEKLSEEIPTGKLVMPLPQFLFSLVLLVSVTQCFFKISGEDREDS